MVVITFSTELQAFRGSELFSADGGVPPNPSRGKLIESGQMQSSADRSSFSAVEIETERLKLVPISMEYMMDCFREYTPEITTYMFHAPSKDPSVVEEVIRTSIEDMKNGSNLPLVILKKDTGEFLGRVELIGVQTKHLELGGWVKKSAHGNGYGKEAMTAMKKWADAHIDYEYIVYPVDKDNIASRKIPEALGGVVHGQYDKPTPSGKILHTMEYRIYPSGSVPNKLP